MKRSYSDLAAGVIDDIRESMAVVPEKEESYRCTLHDLPFEMRVVLVQQGLRVPPAGNGGWLRQLGSVNKSWRNAVIQGTLSEGRERIQACKELFERDSWYSAYSLQTIHHSLTDLRKASGIHGMLLVHLLMPRLPMDKEYQEELDVVLDTIKLSSSWKVDKGSIVRSKSASPITHHIKFLNCYADWNNRPILEKRDLSAMDYVFLVRLVKPMTRVRTVPVPGREQVRDRMKDDEWYLNEILTGVILHSPADGFISLCFLFDFPKIFDALRTNIFDSLWETQTKPLYHYLRSYYITNAPSYDSNTSKMDQLLCYYGRSWTAFYYLYPTFYSYLMKRVIPTCPDTSLVASIKHYMTLIKEDPKIVSFLVGAEVEPSAWHDVFMNPLDLLVRSNRMTRAIPHMHQNGFYVVTQNNPMEIERTVDDYSKLVDAVGSCFGLFFDTMDFKNVLFDAFKKERRRQFINE